MKIILFLILLLSTTTISAQRINLIGYQLHKVEALMAERECEVESVAPFGDGTMIMYNDGKMPISYIYLIGGSDNACYGFSVVVKNQYKKFLDAFIQDFKTNENFTEAGDNRWIERYKGEAFEWLLKEAPNTDSRMLVVKLLKEKN